MAYEAATDRETEEFNSICAEFGRSGCYEIFMKRNWNNIGSFRTVTVRNRSAGVCESYYADNHPENPRYWLKRFSQVLATKRFGSSTD